MFHFSKRWWLWKKPVMGWHWWLWKEPVVMCGKWNVRQATLQQMFKVTTFYTDICFQFFRHWSTAASTTLCWNSAHVATRRYPRFRTCVFKSHSLPTMWPILVEFRSPSSEGTLRNKIKKEERGIPVKYKSADMYVGRPKVPAGGKALHRLQLSCDCRPTCNCNSRIAKVVIII